MSAERTIAHLSAQLALTTADKVSLHRTLLEVESTAARDREDASGVRRQLADLQASSDAQAGAVARQHSDEVAALSQQLTAASGLYAAAQGSMADLTAQCNRVNDELGAARAAVGDLTAAKVGAESTLTEVQHQLKRSEQDLTHAVRSFTELTASAAAAKATADKSMRDAEALATRLSDENSSLKQALFTAEAAARTRGDEKDALSLAVREKSGFLAATTREVEYLRVQRKKDEIEMAGLRELVDLGEVHAGAVAAAEVTIGAWEVRARKDQVEMDRLRRQVSEGEGAVRRVTEEADRCARLADELTSSKGCVEKELEGVKAHVRKEAEVVSALRRGAAEGEIQRRKDADEVERLGVLLAEAATAKGAADRSVGELTAQVRRVTNEAAGLRKELELLMAEQSGVALAQVQGERDKEEIERLRRAVVDLTASKGGSERTLADLQVAHKGACAELEGARRQFLEGELIARSGREECLRQQKVLDEVTAARYAAEKAVAEVGAVAKRDREEVDRLRKECAEMDSQRRRDGDEITRLGHLLMDSTAAKGAAVRGAADLEGLVKRQREELEGQRRLVDELTSGVERVRAEGEERRRVG